MPREIMLTSKIDRQTLKAKGYDFVEGETGKATVGQELMRLLEKLADDKPVVSTRRNDEPEITIRKKKKSHVIGLKESREPREQRSGTNISLKIPEDILRQKTLRRKKVSCKEEVEERSWLKEG